MDLVKQMNVVLANTYALYLKTQKYHWNVKGVHFASLHLFFEGQYDELAESVDAIAEHIRMLGFDAQGSFNEFQALNKITDGNAHMDAAGMIGDLLDSHNIVVNILTTTLELAQKIGDEVIADFMIQRLAAHRKQQWMLRSLQ
ncbi:MAG: DNA starvation/stationary phase protection protein [Gammaproteobacteria bacterium]|jgi:starvation-inducible DNA-binding protein